jgi:hypothetical protein
MTAVDPAAPSAPEALDEEAAVDPAALAADADAAYEALVRRLSRQSVEKHFDAYADIAWDDPEMAIRHDDPRWAAAAERIFGRTEWFATLTPDEQARLGLWRIASAMKLGLEFENILKRGLLEYAFRLPNGSPEFRYVYHETIEEAHHALMFQEFVNRTGLPIRGLAAWEKVGSRQVVGLARWFPSLFFLFVLGGEDPIDHTQRTILREGGTHPLVDRIMRIHVTEEARHLSFARHHLKHEVPKMSAPARAVLRVAAPILLGEMAKQMLSPPRQLVREFRIPPEVVRDLTQAPEARDAMRASLEKVRRLCVDLGLVPRRLVPLWRAVGLWPDAR